MVGSWRLSVLIIVSIQHFIQAIPSGLNSSTQKRTIELQTAYVYRKGSQRSPHYSVILGSSGKPVEGPPLPSLPGDEVHRVQGIVISNNDVVMDESPSFSKAGILVHNRYRMLHHAPPLTWSDNLAEQAERVAYELAKKKSDDSKRSKIAMDTVGENVEKLFSVSYNCDGRAAIEAIDRWYKEGSDFSYSYLHLSEKTNSFTQLIWKGTSMLGMGCALRRGLLTNDVFVVALYSPPGNVIDDVATNVLRSGEMKHKDDVYSNIF